MFHLRRNTLLYSEVSVKRGPTRRFQRDVGRVLGWKLRTWELGDLGGFISYLKGEGIIKGLPFQSYRDRSVT